MAMNLPHDGQRPVANRRRPLSFTSKIFSAPTVTGDFVVGSGFFEMEASQLTLARLRRTG
jgi:hypothetical protein